MKALTNKQDRKLRKYEIKTLVEVKPILNESKESGRYYKLK